MKRRLKAADLFACLAVAAGVVAVAACGQPAQGETARRNTVTERLPYGVRVFTDPATGCEYLLLVGRSITPRMERSSYNSDNGVRGCQ